MTDLSRRPSSKRISLTAVVLTTAGLIVSCSDFGSAPPTAPGGGGTGELSVAPLTAAEGSSANFNVTLTSTIGSTVKFTWTVTPMSAVAGDFSGSLTGTDSILAGATGKVVAVATADDILAEGSELFRFTLSAPVNATIMTGSVVAVISPNDGGVDVSWAGTVKPLLLSACASCHPSSGGGFSVITVASITTTGTHAPNVVPGDGVGSNLYDKLASSSPSRGGSRMPQGGPFFNATQLNIVRDWIDQGAQDN